MGQSSERNQRYKTIFKWNAHNRLAGRKVTELAEVAGINYRLCSRWMREGLAHASIGEKRNNEEELKKFAEALGFDDYHDLWREVDFDIDHHLMMNQIKRVMEAEGFPCDDLFEKQLLLMMAKGESHYAIDAAVDRKIRKEQSRTLSKEEYQHFGRVVSRMLDKGVEDINLYRLVRIKIARGESLLDIAKMLLGISKPVTQTLYETVPMPEPSIADPPLARFRRPKPEDGD